MQVYSEAPADAAAAAGLAAYSCRRAASSALVPLTRRERLAHAARSSSRLSRRTSSAAPAPRSDESCSDVSGSAAIGRAERLQHASWRVVASGVDQPSAPATAAASICYRSSSGRRAGGRADQGAQKRKCANFTKKDETRDHSLTHGAVWVCASEPMADRVSRRAHKRLTGSGTSSRIARAGILALLWSATGSL